MAANSIAKLAVIITGDTSPLNASMNQATDTVRHFARETEHGGGALYALASSFKVGVQGMHAFEGSTRGIIHTLHNLASPTGAALVAAAGLVFLGYEALKAADNMATARNKIRKEYSDAVEALTGVQNAGGAQEGTMSQAWKEAKEAIEEVLAVIATNTGAVEYFVHLFQTAAGYAKEFAESFKTEEDKATDRAVENMKRRTDAIKEQVKEQEKLKREAEAEAERQRRSAESLARSLRTPFEVMKDSLQEAFNFQAGGLIGPDIYARAVKKIGDEFMKASEHARELKSVGFAGAFERGTAAEYSQRLRGGAEAQRIAAEQKRTADLTAKVAEATKSIDTTLKKTVPVNLKIGRLTGT